MSQRAQGLRTEQIGGASAQGARPARLRWFAPIPVAMAFDSSLSSDALRLAVLLLHYDGPEGCFPRVETLMRDLAASKNKVLRLIEELERYRFLTREKRGRNNRYRLHPIYEPPIRQDAIEATGQLEVENASRPRPPKRNDLHRKRAAPPEPMPEKVPSVEPIPIKQARRKQVPVMEPVVGKRTAEDIPALEPDMEAAPPERVPALEPLSVPAAERELRDRFQPWDLDITNNQRSLITSSSKSDAAAELARAEEERRLQLESDLREIPGITPIIAATVALDLIDEDPRDVIEAARLLVTRRRFREGRVPNPSGYLREVVRSQVRLDRLRQEHEQQKHQTRAAMEEGRAQFQAVFPTLEPETQALIRQAAYAICSNEQSPAWPIAMQLALRHYLSRNPQLPSG